MNALNIAVVEDNDEDAAILGEFLKRYSAETGRTFEVKRFCGAFDFVSDYKPVYDLIFLDIMMPDLNGMDAAARIRETDESVVLAFVTNLAQFAIQSYEVDASEFILKPPTYAVFREKMSKLTRLSERARKKVPLLVNDDYGRTVRIFASDVFYVLKEKNYVYFYLSDAVYKRREELKIALPRLKGAPFLQVNSGCCVNLDYLDEITQKSVKVKGEIFPIARARKKLFIDGYMKYLNGERDGGRL